MILQILQKKVFRYLIAGGFAFIGEYATFLLLFYELKVSVVAANAISFMTGFIISFTLNKFWVFRTGLTNIYQQAILYTGIAMLNAALTSVAIQILVNAGLAGYIAKIILTACVAVWNFLLFKYVVFRPSSS